MARCSVTLFKLNNALDGEGENVTASKVVNIQDNNVPVGEMRDSLSFSKIYSEDELSACDEKPSACSDARWRIHIKNRATLSHSYVTVAPPPKYLD